MVQRVTLTSAILLVANAGMKFLSQCLALHWSKNYDTLIITPVYPRVVDRFLDDQY